MNYSVNAQSNIPAYIQIYQQLRDDIVNKIYFYGQKIPSKRILADETGVSVITIRHALDLLCEEGYIEAKQRSGYYVIFMKDEFFGTISPVNSAPIHSSSSHNTGEFPFTVLAKTMRKVILNYEDKMLVRSPNLGCLELRKEICSYLARSRSIHVEPEQVVIGSGAEYIYGLIAQMFTKETHFAIENPCYDKIRQVYESFGITCDSLTLNPEGIDSSELRSTAAKVLHTTPFNSFPSGITISSSKKHELLNWAKKNEGFIIEDNYDSELTVSSKPEDSIFAMSDQQNVIYINTFSRTIAPSMRIGYMLLPKKLIDFYNEKLGFYSCTVPVFDQFVLAELLHSGDFERHINRVRRKRRAQLNAL